MLPNLIVIGAMKSGTTSLHHYLKLHPEIEMSEPKELHFFWMEKNVLRPLKQGNWSQGLKWYESHFTKEAKIHGEASTTYTKYPWISGVPKRMYSIVPEAKLIYLLRDPIDRILSEYVHYRTLGTEHRTLSEALNSLKNNRYVHNSKYYTQLKQYLEFYPEASIFIITTGELKRQPEQTLQKVFRFLDVDDSFSHPGFTKRHHVSSKERRLKNPLGVFLTKKFGQSRIKDKIRSALPLYVDQAYRAISSGTVEKPALDDQLKQVLINELKDDIEQLRNYTGNKFEYWCL